MSFTITICVINIALGEPAPSIWNAFEAHSLNTHIQLEQLNKCGLVPIIWVLLETSWLQSIVYLSTIVNTISYKSFNLFSISIPLKRTLIICMINDHENLVIVFMKNFLGTGLFIVLSLKNGRKFSLVEGGGGLLADSIWSSRNLFPPSGCNQLALKVHRRLVTEQANTHNSKQHTINKLSPERLLCDIFCPFFHYAYFTGYFIKFR